MQDGGQRKRKVQARARALCFAHESVRKLGRVRKFELIQYVLLSSFRITQDKTLSYYQMFEGEMVYILATTKYEEN